MSRKLSYTKRQLGTCSHFSQSLHKSNTRTPIVVGLAGLPSVLFDTVHCASGIVGLVVAGARSQ